MSKTINGYYYPDTCKIMRGTGEEDANGIESFSDVYSGDCEMQFGSNHRTYLKGETYLFDAKIYIPVTDVMFKVNDRVEITTTNDRKVTCTVLQWLAISDSVDKRLNNTTIWLKSGVDE